MRTIQSNHIRASLCCALLGAILSLCWTRPARAQTWTGAVNGSWNIAGNWSSNPTLPPSSIDTALIFNAAGAGGTALTQNLANPFILNTLSFNAAASAYTIGGNALDFRFSSTAAGAHIDYITNNSVTLTTPVALTSGISIFGTGSGTLALNGAISGPNGLIMNTFATVSLGSASNTYTGTTTVSGFGPLVLGNGNAIPAGRNVSAFGPGTFSTNGLSNSAATAIGTLSLNDGGSFKIPTGSGNYFLNALQASNTSGNSAVDFTGSTSATLHFVNAAAAVTINGFGGVSNWIGAGISRIVNDTAAPLNITLTNLGTLNSSVRLANGSAGQGFRFGGGGFINLTNTGNTANLIVDEANILSVTDMAFLGSGSLTLANTTNLAGATGMLRYTGPSSTSPKGVTIGANGGTIQVAAPGTNLAITGVVSDISLGARFTVIGDGSTNPVTTLTLTGANTYSGPTVIGTGSILSIPTFPNGGVAGPLGASSNAPANLLLGGVNGGSGTLQYTGPTTTTNRAMTLADPFAVQSIDISNAATTLTLAGQITGAAALTKRGPGTLTLTAPTNNYAGGTNVAAGKLVMGSGTALPGDGDVSISGGAELNTNGLSNTFSSPMGKLSLNGGTLRSPSAATNFFLNRVETDAAGGSIDYSGSGTSLLRLVGTGVGVTIRGNSTWIANGASAGSRLSNDTGVTADLIVSPGVTWTNGFSLVASSAGYRLTGGGTLFQLGASNSASMTIEGARYRIDSIANLPTNSLTVNGGTLQYSGPSATSSRQINLGQGGIEFSISNVASTLTYSGLLNGNGPVVKSGPGTLVLNNTGNTFLGDLTISNGRVEVAGDNFLGFASPTVHAAGTLSYVSNATTSRTFNLLGGSLEIPFALFLTLDGATVGGGFIRGTGNVVVQGGTILSGTTTTSSAIIQQNGPATVSNFTNNGQFFNNVGRVLTLNSGTNTSAGGFFVSGIVNATDFTSNGDMGIVAGATLNHTGTHLVLGGGSTTAIGSVAAPGGTINLGGQSLDLRGGLLVNNGTISNGTVNVNFGGLAKGAGVYPTVNVLDGGRFSPGNSPGTVTSGSVIWGAGAGYDFEINDAAGNAGTNWDLWNMNGGLSITAGTTNNSRFTVSIISLNAGNSAGDAANFSSAQNYSWLIASTTTGITGFDTAKFTLDTSKFFNPLGGGTFAISQVGNNVFLNFNGVSTPPQWNVDAGGSWATAANWLPPSVPNGATATANFLGKITAPRTITLDGDKTVASIAFDNGNSYTIAPGSGGTLTVGDGTSGSITVTSGSHEISAPIAFAGSVTKTGGGTLTISGAQNHAASSTLTVKDGQLNLSSNAGTTAGGSAAVARLALSINNSGRVALGANQDLRSLDITTSDPGPQQLNLNSPGAGLFRAVHVYASDLAAAKTSLYSAMRNALAPGAPDPTDGIFDSGRGLHANSGIGLALVNDAHGDPSIFIRLTRIGDLNLDGQVSISDFIDLAAHFNGPGTWQEGDLNYDGQVTISDFIDLASNFNTNYAGETWPISPADQQALSTFAAAVPEPNIVLAILALSTAAMAGRRRL